MKSKMNNLRIAFRVEANEKIGIGHIMRCLTIMRQFHTAGISCTIYSCSEIENALFRGVAEFVKIEVAAFSREDAIFVKQQMEVRQERTLFIDSYEITAEYVGWMKGVERIILADSFCDYDVEMVIQPNAYMTKNNPDYSCAKVYLRGIEYQPIRNEFFEKQTVICKNISRILILSGGTVPEKFIIELLKNIYRKYGDCQVTVVLGRYASEETAEKLKGLFFHYYLRICQNVSNLEDIMRMNDIVISACGSTIYEIMACGLPVIAYSMAENQRYALEYLQEVGGIIYAGDVDEKGTCMRIVKELTLMADEALRKRQVAKMKKLVSCNGAENIVQAVIKKR